MPAGKRAVQHDTRLEVLKTFEIFDENGNLLPESNQIWDQACQKLELKKRNLYEYVHQNRHQVKVKLLEYFNENLNQKEVDNIDTYDQPNNQILDNNVISEVENKSEGDSSQEESSDEENCQNANQMQTKNETDMITALHRLRLDIHYKKFIRQTSYFNFYTMWWSPEQLQFYKLLMNELLCLELVILEDCVNEIQMINHRSGKINLYSIVGTIDWNNVFSFSHMLSENSCKLYLWLSEWIRSGAPIPAELLCPSTYKVLVPVCDALNGSNTYEQYLLQCFNFVQNQAYLLPKCVIYIDVRSVLSWISNLQCFQKENVKNFYVHCTLYLSTIDEWDRFIKTLQEIFVLLLSDSENEVCINYRKNFVQNFKLHDDLNWKTQKIDISDIMLSSVPEEMKLFFKGKSEEINYLCSTGLSFSDVPNAYFCKEFSDHLILLCCHFPLWTSLLTKKSACTSLSSLYFAVTAKSKLNVDQFIQENVRKVENDMRNTRTELHTQKLFKKSQECNLEQSYLYKNENWMGLGDEKYDYCMDNEKDVTADITENLESCTMQILSNESFINEKDNSELLDIISSQLKLSSENNDHQNNLLSALKCNEEQSYDEKENANAELSTENKNNQLELSPTFHGEHIDDFKPNTPIDCQNNSIPVSCNENINKTTEISTSGSVMKKKLPKLENNKASKQISKTINKLSSKNKNINLSECNEQMDFKVIELNVLGLSTHTYIVNGNKLGPVEYDGSLVQVTNTCPIDSIFELIILTLQKDNYMQNLFYSSLTTVDNLNIFPVLMLYIANECSINYLYQERFRIMLQIKEKLDDPNTLNCHCNINGLFSILINSSCNNTTNIFCYDCNHSSTEALPVVTPRWLSIILHGISCLEEEVNIALKDSTVFCEGCSGQAHLTRSINSFLIIDLEDCYRDQIIQELRKFEKYSCISSKSMFSKIKEIPKIIKVKDKIYTLSGIIAFIEPKSANGIAHYITIFYHGKDKWEVRDGLAQNVCKMIESKVPMMCKIASMLYVPQDTTVE